MTYATSGGDDFIQNYRGENMKYLIVIYVILFNFVSLESKPVWNNYLDSEFENDGKISYIWKISCADTNNIFALNLREDYYGRIFSSMDKGKTWCCIYNEFPGTYSGPEITCINMSNPIKDYIYLTYAHSTLRITKDACKTWDTVNFEPNDLRLNYIYMADSLNGIICGQPYPSGDPHLLFTNDGWKSYKAIPRDSLPLELFLFGAYMEGTDTLMFITCKGDRTFVNWSYDKSITWTTDTLNGIGTANPYFKRFIKAPTGEYWLVGYLANGIGDQSYDVIYKLDKIGGTWTKVYSGDLEPTFGLQEIAFGDSLNGVAVGQFGKILRTTDGGETWFQEFLTYNGKIDDTDPPVMHVEYCGSTPLIGDFDGRIFRLEDDGTGDVEEASFFCLYPNPASEFINIDEAMLNGSNNIELYNALGIMVLDVSPAVSRINISVLSAGIYSLKCGDKVQSFVKY